MQVRRVDLIESDGPVDGPLSARMRWESRAGLLLRVEDADGRVGIGEASPLPFYSPETLYEAHEALRAVDWPALPEADAGEPALDWLSRLPEGLLGGVPSARFALETALLDLLGQRRNAPIHRLLSDAATPVPLCFLLGGAGDESVIASAERAAEAGAHTLKLKITGPELGEQLQLLGRIRAVAGAAALRLDANRTFADGTWEHELGKLEELRPELVEEPAPVEALLRARSSPVPTALDESLQNMGDWEQLVPALSALRCAALVLKPTTLGGFAACHGWASRAREQHLDVTVSHTFEGPVALAAGAHLAIAIASRARASGLSRHGGLAAWPDVPLPLLEPARLVPAEAPGLGVPASHFD
jgi:o-succinylbenzoate synthase